VVHAAVHAEDSHFDLSSGDLKLSISNDDWQRIESAYGHAVPTNARERIHGAMLEFLRFVEAEHFAHPVSEARKRVERVKKAATEFKTAIFEQDIGLDARTYANHLIKLHFKDARRKQQRRAAPPCQVNDLSNCRLQSGLAGPKASRKLGS
jgi:hypothetical protein